MDPEISLGTESVANLPVVIVLGAHCSYLFLDTSLLLVYSRFMS